MVKRPKGIVRIFRRGALVWECRNLFVNAGLPALASLMAGVIVLALLLVFILENTQRVKISFFGASGHLPLGVALLIAAVAGALLVGIVASVRIVQLRRRAKRTAKRP